MTSVLKNTILKILFLLNISLAGTIDGYVYLENQTDHSGVTITFEFIFC